MDIRNGKLIAHPLKQYQLAKRYYKKAKKLCSLIMKDKATEQDEVLIREYIWFASDLFTGLTKTKAWDTTLYFKTINKIDLYLIKIGKMCRKLQCKKDYAYARKLLKEADECTEINKKRELYKKTMEKFGFIHEFSDARFYKELAALRYYKLAPSEQVINKKKSNFFHPAQPEHKHKSESQYDSEPEGWVEMEICSESELKIDIEPESIPEFSARSLTKLSIFIDDTYDLCLRASLPRLGQELFTTTIITPAGVFQLNKYEIVATTTAGDFLSFEKNSKYIQVLDPSELIDLKLEQFITKAKKLNKISAKTIPHERLSIRYELSQDQLAELNMALINNGGNSLFSNEEASHNKRLDNSIEGEIISQLILDELGLFDLHFDLSLIRAKTLVQIHPSDLWQGQDHLTKLKQVMNQHNMHK